MDVPHTDKIEFYEPLLDILGWFKGLVPTSWKPGRPHFNFITIHYMYLIGLTIVGSVILYPAKIFSYTDALFFAAGAATQSGLNTVDVNTLETYQQIAIMLVACIANPVFINTVVVFIRLYWFEKRFQGIVKDAQKSRRYRTMSRSRSQMREEKDNGALEDARSNGVNGQPIKVLHHAKTVNGTIDPRGSDSTSDNGELISPKTKNGRPVETGVNGMIKAASEEKAPETYLGRNPLLTREIAFADEQKARTVTPPTASLPRSDDEDRLPEQRSPEAHIAFLERQRKKDTTLRIPGPRDFDRGDGPQEVDSDEEDGALARSRTVDPGDAHAVRRSDDTTADRAMSNAVKREIVFDEPARPQREPQEEKKKGKKSTPHSARFNPLRPWSMFEAGGARPRFSSAALTNTITKLGQGTRTFSFSRTQERSDTFNESMPYLSWQPTIGRNSAFIDLTEEQREELGGVEYRSLKTLALILVGYFVGFHILGMIVLLPWIVTSTTYGPIVDAVAQSRAWWGIFTPASMFNDLGFTLTPDSMVSFQTAVLPLLFGSFLIVIGNTGFPCMLRFIIWVMYKLNREGTPLWEELRFLLDHPRRCFTLLFPSKATWWLFWLLVLLNGIDLIFFIILDLNDETVTSLSAGIRVLVGWFQAVSTRTAGFAAINLANLHPAIQVSYLIMMYISVFPIAISVRRTNVYEEKSLGIWGGEGEDEEGDKSYVGTHLRRQLSFDLWYIFMGLFIIAIAEGRRLENTNEYAFTLFSVLFEIVSAYGTVGLSLGYPNSNASFSAQFGVLSKLIIIAMMLRGRHRGLPYALDRAILLPSENLHKKESEEAARRAGRRNSMSVRDATGTLTSARRSMSRPRNDDDDDVPDHDPLTGVTSAALTFQSAQTHQPGGGSPTLRRAHLRRPSELSDRPPSTRSRQRTLTGLISAGLSAGPSTPKDFKKYPH